MSAPLDVAQDVAQRALARLVPFLTRGAIAGSVRRCKPMVKDVELVVIPAQLTDGFLGETRLAVPELREVAARMGTLVKGGPKMIQIEDLLGSGLNLDLFMVHGYECPCDDCRGKKGGNEWGPIFTIRTGPAAYSEWLVTRIKGRLWRCVDGHVIDDRGKYVPCPDEQAFFAAAEVPWIPPQERFV